MKTNSSLKQIPPLSLTHTPNKQTKNRKQTNEVLDTTQLYDIASMPWTYSMAK